LFLALCATASTEYAREAVRKPYVIGSHMYSNSVRVREVTGFNRDGYMTSSMWKPTGANDTQVELGRVIFRGECMSCHTLDGYRSMRNFLADRDEKAIGNILTMLRKHDKESPYSNYMPPLVGSDEEIAALQAYLVSLKSGPGTKVASR
jgi:mono/diheme cytochrome c family protein